MNPTTMRRLASIVIILSVGGFVLLVTMLLRRAQTPAATTQVVDVPVVVALAPVRAREALSSYNGKFHVVTRPKDQVPEDAVQKLEDLDGKYASANIDPGTILKHSQAVLRGNLGTLSSALKPGYVGITVPADRLSILNGALKPDDYVDVLVSADISGKTVSYMVLRNIRVLQVGAETAQSHPAAQTAAAQPAAEPPASTYVTVEVRQDQVSRLALAVSKGHIQLVLRGVGSGVSADVPVPPASTDDVFPTGQKKVAPRPAPPTRMARNSGGNGPLLPPADPRFVTPGPGSGALLPQHPIPIKPVSTQRSIFIIRGGTQETVTFPTQ